MSRSPDVKYHRLSQEITSEDEDEGFEDNILFDSRLVNGTTTDDRNIFEMEELGLPRIRSSQGFQNDSMRKQRWCLAIFFIVLLLVAGVCGVIIPLLQARSHEGKVVSVETETNAHSVPDWKRTFFNTWTESSIFLMDVDKDRFDDIIVGLAYQSSIEAVLGKPENVSMRDFCKSTGVDYPCGGTVAALRGSDGALLWQTNTRSVVIHQTCVDLEIGGDMKHCIVTGRHSTCQAVESFTGKVQWVVDPEYPVWSSHFVPKWNTYQALKLPDLDDDGTLDLLISHGGDKDKEPEDHDRQAGRLILLSGLTGYPIGEHFLELPDSKETYMPPIKYVTPSGAIYILIGTGGETIQGSLLAISLPDLYQQVTKSDLKVVDLDQYTWLENKLQDQSGFVNLYSGQTKGLMVPPVVIDSNNDGAMDLLVTSFDGEVTLLDGKTLEPVWSVPFEGMETYSSPAPGFFNDDATLDWLIHLNQGVWDKYNNSKTLILNGNDGSVMWSTEHQSYAYSSDLSIQVNASNSHMFIAKMVGLNSTQDSLQETIGLKKRHLIYETDQTMSNLTEFTTAEEFQSMCNTVQSDLRQNHALCKQDLESLTQDILMFDKKLSHYPLRILQQKAERFHYQVDHKPDSFHCHALSERQKDKINMCMVLVPTSYTGAVGDVNGDNHFDYVHMSQMVGTRYSDSFSPVGSISKVVLSKHNLWSVMARKDFVPLNQRVHDEDESNAEQENFDAQLQHIDSVQFRALQGWCQYLGCRGDSWYRVPSST